MTITVADPRGMARTGALVPVAAIPMDARVDALRFLAAYAYSPAGTDPVSRRSRRLCAAIKAADPEVLAGGARTIAALVRQRADFAAHLDPDAVLVPVPSSVPRPTAETDVSVDIARALARCGIGAGVRAVLARGMPVRKSATAPVGARPSVGMHFASFRIVATPLESAAAAFVLVDDVVSRGRTLLAAACRLRERFPRTPIVAGALMRTLGYVTDLPGLTAPCLGDIRWRHGDAVRRP
jgi:hypothetical protein